MPVSDVKKLFRINETQIRLAVNLFLLLKEEVLRGITTRIRKSPGEHRSEGALARHRRLFPQSTSIHHYRFAGARIPVMDDSAIADAGDIFTAAQ